MRILKIQDGGGRYLRFAKMLINNFRVDQAFLDESWTVYTQA